jgi:hypothetical protein
MDFRIVAGLGNLDTENSPAAAGGLGEIVGTVVAHRVASLTDTRDWLRPKRGREDFLKWGSDFLSHYPESTLNPHGRAISLLP